MLGNPELSSAYIEAEIIDECKYTVEPGKSIQEAINESKESGERLTICIKPGVYEENLIINHPVRLVGLLNDPQKEEVSNYWERKN